MRELGYGVVDRIVEHLETLRSQPVAVQRSRSELEPILGEIPKHGLPPGQVLERTVAGILSSITRVNHPRFYAFVPGPGNFVGAMADALASGFNVFAGHWLAASGPSAVEMKLVEWLARACGLPQRAGGLLVSGGSMANLTALAAARFVKLGGHDPAATVYFSDQTHSSLPKGLRVLGFSLDQLRVLPSDDTQRLDPTVLASAVAGDRERGRRPFCVVANAGTTNTGAVDPLEDLASLARAENLWLHVDGAYGAAAVLSERGRSLLRGLGEADSIALDPHKWLFQPFEIGCVLVRERRHLAATYAVRPEDQATYLEDVGRIAEEEFAFFEHGIQLTRYFRALKLWMSLQVFGYDAFRKAIERGIALGEAAEAAIRSDARWEVVTPAQLAVVTFAPAPGRWQGAGDTMVQGAVAGLMADGYAAVTSTQVRGRTVLRLCLIHPDAQLEEVRETLERLARYAGM
jgi:glutamate/tyrosine decarboxylase-like PLP-dependent enzyme